MSDDRGLQTGSPDAVSEQSGPENPAPRHAEIDLRLRPILLFGGAILGGTIVVFLVLWWLLQAWTGQTANLRAQIPPALVTPAPGPGPALQASDAAERLAVTGPALERIDTYGWVDRQTGVVRIPITRAMELLVQRGLPASGGAPPKFGLDPAYELESEGGQGTGGDGGTP